MVLCTAVDLRRAVLLLLPPLALLLFEADLALLLRAPLARFVPAALPPFRARPRPPFCSPTSTDALCDAHGEVRVGVPAWALAPLPAAREATVLPDVLGFPWHIHNGQHGEDFYAARDLFYGIEGGLVVESGALDGQLFSSTTGLMDGRGWHAVHVEANPENFAALARNRPESLNFHAALCSASESLHYVSDAVVRAAGVARTFAPNAEGMTPVSGFWEFMSASLRERWWAGLNDSTVATFPKTPCRSLSHLLQLFGISHVDMWVLDVEGAEDSVLAGFNFSSVTVDVVCVELDGTAPDKDERARTTLRENGFILHRKGHPHPFRLPDDTVLQMENTMESAIGLDNEWWIHKRGFTISYEAMARASRGDLTWTPHAQQVKRPAYADKTRCCYSRNPE